jgi:hypothetical protein
MQSRFAIILMSVAGAGLLFCVGLLFGLGVMSSPKGGQHKEIAVTTEPVKVARRETTGSAATSDRPLTPLIPVHPGTSEPAPAAAANASAPQAPAPAQAPAAQAATEPAVAAPAQETAVAQKPVAPATEAKLAPAPKPLPAKPAASEKPVATPVDATPVALHRNNSCAVDACARAYRSFRESDCTYQPYSGPRQLCVSPPAPAKEASRGDERSASVRVHRGNRDIEVQNVPRDGARLTDGASPRDEDGPPVRREFRRDFAADGEDGGIDDSRVIVRRGDGDRSYDGGGWHRSFFAPVDDEDDDQ